MESTVDFKSFDLDPRLMKAIKKMGYTHPTLIQAEAIPLALQGKDIVARAKTGSGKTAAYCIPLMQKILKRKDEEASLGGSTTRASKLSSLILVPTKELSEQVKDTLDRFTQYTYKLITVCNLCSLAPEETSGGDASIADVVIGTPGTVSRALDLEWIDLGNLETLVLDEADLLVSYGYRADLEGIAGRMPRICQGMLMSATFSGDVENLKRLVLRTPVVLKLTEPESEGGSEGGDNNNNNNGGQITEYTIPVGDDKERFTALYAVLKLGIVAGKAIIFVNESMRCFRLKLFLDKFSIKTAVLNSDLPLNSRLHTIQEFNRGAFQYLIASDDSDALSNSSSNDNGEDDDDDDDEFNSENDESEEEDDDEKSTEKARKNKKASKKKQAKKKSGDNVSSTEFSMSRGIDFVDVAAVINFDLPKTVDSYVHRIGRTGRGTASGIAVSFFTKKESGHLKKVIKRRSEDGHEVKPYEIKASILGSFRYRCEDVYRGITLVAVKRAAETELRAEILNSEKLRDHFKENPREEFILRNQLKHDRSLLKARAPRELKEIPEYLLPPALGGMSASELIQDVELGKEDSMDFIGRKRVRHGSDIAKRPRKKKKDGDYIPVALGGKHSPAQRKKSDINAAFKTKKKYRK